MRHRNEDAYDDMVRDGQAVRVPMFAMDGAQRSIAANSHGQLSDELLQLRARTRAAYDQQLTNAWRSPATTAKKVDSNNAVLSLIDANPQRARAMARNEMIRRLTDAWRPKLRDQEPDEDDPDAANEVQRELEQTLGRDPDKLDDLARAVEARRRRQHADFSQRLSEAWKTK